MGQSTPISQGRDTDNAGNIINQLNQLDDPREAYACVERAISDCEIRGEEVPAELLKAKRVAMLECQQQSQGR